MGKNQLIDFKKISISSLESPTLADRRLFNYLLHNTLAQESKMFRYKVNFEYLSGVFGVAEPTIDQLEQTTQLLMRILVRIETSNKNIIFPLFTEVSIDTKQEILHYSFSKRSHQTYSSPILLEQCLIQAHFIHKYTTLIYELIAPHYYLNNTNSFEIDMQALRDHLGLEANKLTNFADFSRFVLQPSIKELNTHASFYLEITPQRIGRKISSLTFNITTQRNISGLEDSLSVIPPMRPKLNLTRAQKVLYAKILNASTKKRQTYFDNALVNAKAQDETIDERLFDLPDLWLEWL